MYPSLPLISHNPVHSEGEWLALVDYGRAQKKKMAWENAVGGQFLYKCKFYFHFRQLLIAFLLLNICLVMAKALSIYSSNIISKGSSKDCGITNL